jgi:hypothetical protein
MTKDLVEFFFEDLVFVVKHTIKFCDGLYGMAESLPWPWGGSVNPHFTQKGGPLSFSSSSSSSFFSFFFF